MAMQVSIRRATASDIPSIGRISHYAFANHPWTRCMYPVPDAAGNMARYRMRTAKAIDDPKNSFFVAVNGPASDPSSPIIGYSKWTIHPEPRPEAEWNRPYVTIPVPEGALQSASDVPGEVLHQMRLRMYKGEPHVLLNFLVIDVKYQRKGVGRQLLRWGIQRADELRLPAYLEATPEGYDLYYKNGFRTVDEMLVETKQWGQTEPIHLKCMKYEPRANTTASVEAYNDKRHENAASAVA